MATNYQAHYYPYMYSPSKPIDSFMSNRTWNDMLKITPIPNFQRPLDINKGFFLFSSLMHVVVEIAKDRHIQAPGFIH